MGQGRPLVSQRSHYLGRSLQQKKKPAQAGFFFASDGSASICRRSRADGREERGDSVARLPIRGLT